MKCFALLAIIIFGLAQQPAKTSVPNKTNTPVQNQTEAASHTDKPSGEDLKIQQQLARFTGLLVVVGFLQLIALVGQACLFFRQARIMGEHRVSLEQLAVAASDNAKAAKDGAEAANKNAEFSKLNAIATEKSADAAKISADTARDSMEMFISKERARLRIEMKPLVFPSESVPIFNTVDFTVNIYGQTDAFVTDSLCVAYIFPWELLNNQELGDKVMFPIQTLPSVVGAHAPPIDCSTLLGPVGGSDDFLIEEARTKRMFVGMRGFIKYKDVFDRERETAFRYMWRYYETGEDYGYWEKSGSPEENRET